MLNIYIYIYILASLIFFHQILYTIEGWSPQNHLARLRIHRGNRWVAFASLHWERGPWSNHARTTQGEDGTATVDQAKRRVHRWPPCEIQSSLRKPHQTRWQNIDLDGFGSKKIFGKDASYCESSAYKCREVWLIVASILHVCQQDGQAMEFDILWVCFRLFEHLSSWHTWQNLHCCSLKVWLCIASITKIVLKW